MPVINLVNIPENDLVFSLHVLWYTPGAHGAHVALQDRNTPTSIIHTYGYANTPPHSRAIKELLLTFRWQEFFTKTEYLPLFKALGDRSPCNPNTLEGNNPQNQHKILVEGRGGRREMDDKDSELRSFCCQGGLCLCFLADRLCGLPPR